MAKRLVCCPSVNEDGGVSLRYWYINSLELIAEDVTDSLAVFGEELGSVCCFDKLIGYANGSSFLEDDIQGTLPFDFYELNSFEIFRSTDELRFKTGSQEVVPYCLLNYYRREYDATQQHTFFSDPTIVVNSARGEGVEHELTLEERVLVSKQEETFIPETLDKGKTLAEREAEAAEALLLAEQEAALAAEDAKALKKEKLEKRRKKARRNAEAELYRDFRNQDDVSSAKYQRMRQYEEDMRAQNVQLSSEYDNGNYASLPGYIPSEVFSDRYESVENATIGAAYRHNDLYAVCSRLDEFGVDYTVKPIQGADGTKRSVVLYTSEQKDVAERALGFAELERQLYAEHKIPENSYFSGFQLQTLDYAYEHNVDTSYVQSGGFNGNQMYRVVEAGAAGLDMGVVANPQYSPTHMDTLNYFMQQGWDTTAIRGTELSSMDLVDHICRQEQQHGVLPENKFFEHHNYDAFVSYGQTDSLRGFSNDYDAAYRQSLHLRPFPVPPMSNIERELHSTPVYSAMPYSEPSLFVAQDGRQYFKDAHETLHDGNGNLYRLDTDGYPAPVYSGNNWYSSYSSENKNGSVSIPVPGSDSGISAVDGVPTPTEVGSEPIRYVPPVPFQAADGRAYYRDVEGILHDGGGNFYALDNLGQPIPIAALVAHEGTSSAVRHRSDAVSLVAKQASQMDVAKYGNSPVDTFIPKPYVPPVAFTAPDGRTYFKDKDGQVFDGNRNQYQIDKTGKLTYVPEVRSKVLESGANTFSGQRASGSEVIHGSGRRIDSPDGGFVPGERVDASEFHHSDDKNASVSGADYRHEKHVNAYAGYHGFCKPTDVSKLSQGPGVPAGTVGDTHGDGKHVGSAGGQREFAPTRKDMSNVVPTVGHKGGALAGSVSDKRGYSAPAAFTAPDGRTYFKDKDGQVFVGNWNLYQVDKTGKLTYVPEVRSKVLESGANTFSGKRKDISDVNHGAKKSIGSSDAVYGSGVHRGPGKNVDSSGANHGAGKYVGPAGRQREFAPTRKDMSGVIHTIGCKGGAPTGSISNKRVYSAPVFFTAQDGRRYFKDGHGSLHDGNGNRYRFDNDGKPQLFLQSMGRSTKGNLIVRTSDGRKLVESADGTLRDSKGKSFSMGTDGSLKRVNHYAFASGFTPEGFQRSDGSFGAGHTYRRQKPSAGGANRANRSAETSGGKIPNAASPGKGPTGRKQRPLDELRVNRSFAQRAGLHVRRYGSQVARIGGQFGQSFSYILASNMAQSDDSGTLSTVRKGTRLAGNVAFTAQIIRDVPRMLAVPGKGISYTSEVLKRTGKPPMSKSEWKEQYLPLRVGAWEKHIESVQNKHYGSIRKKFGDGAASWSIAEIDEQTALCTADLVKERGNLLPANQQLKAELKALHPAAKAAIRKENLIAENQKLKSEIKNLKSKDKLSDAEQKLLDKKIKKKVANEKAIKGQVKEIDGLSMQKKALLQENRKLKAKAQALSGKHLNAEQREKLEKLQSKKAANEKEIGKLAKELKKQKPIIDKDIHKALKLNKKKKANEAILSDKGRKVADLKRLKAQKLAFDVRMKGLKKNLNAAYAASGRLKNIPGRLGYALINKLHESSDTTLSGIGQATGYAMSFARNPLLRLSLRGAKKIFKRASTSKKAVSAKGASGAPKINPGDKIVDLSNNLVKKARHASKASNAAASVKTGAKRLDKATDVIKLRSTASKATTSNIANRFGQKKGVKEWIKRSTRKAIEAGKAAAASAKGMLGAASGGGASAGGAAAGGGAAAAGSSSAGGAALLGGPVLLVVIAVILVVLIMVMLNMSSSYVIPDTETDDGRLDLSEYVEIINRCQDGLQDEIKNLALGTSSVTKRPYDNIFYDYSGKNNSMEILTMAYVRFGLELTDAEAVQAYMEQLYKDSNFADSAESNLYACKNGCLERQYKCYNKPDKYASATRKWLYDASDHSDYALVGDAKGCLYESFSCMKKGHGVYNKNGCSQHNNGERMESPGECNNYSVQTVTEMGEDGTRETKDYYVCNGHCSGKHRDYYCPGHKEVICKGEHQDLTITITSLGFDEIFSSDSSLASSGSYVRGDAYDKKFLITAYCSCHECCHPYDPACTGKPSQTASGTSPKGNHTIAVDPKVIPLGTHVWINGREYVAEDTGGKIQGHRIDIYFDKHQDALNWGARTLTVYKAKPVEVEGDSKDEYGFEGWTKENIQLVKNIYKNMTAEDADELYYGLDAFKDLSYGNYEGDYDFSGVDFGKLDESSLTALQKAVLAVIQKNDLETQKGYCQAWVADVYMKAGTGTRMSKCCANHAGEAWGVSNNWSDIQVGATVYGYSNSIYGHVGIYIGNGKVAHNIGYVKIESLESWVKTYNGKCWGWNYYNLTGLSEYACQPDGTFMTGKD